MSLRAEVAKGFAFEGGKTAITMLVSIVKLAILARLLSPKDFGLLGLAMVLLTGLETLTQVGSDKYLIQKREIEPGLVGSAWIFAISRGAAICVVTLILAPVYGRLMDEPSAVEVLNIVAFVAFVRGWKSPGVYLAERKLDYYKVGMYDVCVTICDAVVVIPLAYFLRDATALAWGMMSSAVIQVVLSYGLFGVGSGFAVSWPAFRELLGVGKHFLIIGVGSYIMIQGDNLIVGAMLGSPMLGYYVIAYKLVDLPLKLTFQITNRVGFSALSRLQGDDKRMRRAFLELFDLQITVLFPLIAFILVAADSIVIVLYGGQWQESVPVVRALGFIMLARGMTHIIVPFLMAQGDYRLISRVKIIETTLFLSAALIGCNLAGMVGVALGGGFGYSVAAAIRLWYVVKVGQIDGRELIHRLLPALLVLSLPIALAVLCEGIMPGMPLVRVFTSGVLFSIAYVALTLLLRRDFVRHVKESAGMFRSAVAHG